MGTEIKKSPEHNTHTFDMPSGLWQAQCQCGWKGEETTEFIAERQSLDHLKLPEGMPGQVVAAINHYGKDEAQRVNRQINPTDTAVMKLRSAGYARYEAGDPTAAMILYREALIQISQEMGQIEEKATPVEAAMVTPMIEVRTIVKEVPMLPAPPKKGIRGLIQRAARKVDSSV